MDVTFHMLALDVLSGRPEPAGSAPDLVDAYEVWGYRLNPGAVAIIRYFDGGSAVACAAFIPDEITGDDRFARAVDRLIALRVPGSPAGTANGRLSDLELLDAVPAFERLGRALALDLARRGVETHPGLSGHPSDFTVGYLEALRTLDPAHSPDMGNSPVFAKIAGQLLSDQARLRWTLARARAHSEHIDVLVHVGYPAATVLVHFHGGAEPPDIAVYVPPIEDSGAHDEILADVRELIAVRALDGPDPLPQPADSRFRRLPQDRVVPQLQILLKQIDAGEGCMHDFPPAADAGARPDVHGDVDVDEPGDPEDDPGSRNRRTMH